MQSNPLPEPPMLSESLTTDTTESLIDLLLLNVQAILERLPPAAPSRDEQDKLVRNDHRIACELTRLLRLDEIRTSLDAVVEQIARCPQGEAQTRITRILPFLDRYNELTFQHLERQSHWTKALWKLEYVACSVMKRISMEGFCNPPEAEEAGANDEDGRPLEGTGLGEGTGSENVSKDIQDESQVEGLQGEDTEGDEKVERAEEDNAIEMSEDVGGELQDVSGGEETDGEGDDDDEPEPEERMGDLDPSDPSQIDEKLWNNDDGPQDHGNDSSSTDKGQSHQKESSEIAAKEAGDDEKDHQAETEDQGKQEQPNSSEEAEQQQDEGEVTQEGLPMDEYVDTGDILDLPEDMNIGEEKDVDREDDDISMGDMDDGMAEDEVHLDEGLPEEMEDQQEDGLDSALEAEQSNPDPTPEGAEDPTVARPDVQSGEGTGADDKANGGAGTHPDAHANAPQDKPDDESMEPQTENSASEEVAEKENISDARYLFLQHRANVTRC